MKKKNEKPKKEIKIPDDKRNKFESLIDRFMDTHNMTADAAREKALREIGLNENTKEFLYASKMLEAREKFDNLKKLLKMKEFGLL